VKVRIQAAWAVGAESEADLEAGELRFDVLGYGDASGTFADGDRAGSRQWVTEYIACVVARGVIQFDVEIPEPQNVRVRP
jgi:hypothetical protein